MLVLASDLYSNTQSAHFPFTVKIKGTDRSIQSNGKGVVKKIGWEQHRSKHCRIVDLNYPYAIMFERHRKMISIRGYRHPNVAPIRVSAINSIEIKLPLNFLNSRILNQVREVLIPRVIKRTDSMIA